MSQSNAELKPGDIVVQFDKNYYMVLEGVYDRYYDIKLLVLKSPHDIPGSIDGITTHGFEKSINWKKLNLGE